MSEELKPCPFCEAEGKLGKIENQHYVKCGGSCFMRPTTALLKFYPTREEAVAVWNFRGSIYTGLIEALTASNKELIAERDCLHESHFDPDADCVVDQEGIDALAHYDAIIDRNNAILEKVT